MGQCRRRPVCHFSGVDLSCTLGTLEEEEEEEEELWLWEAGDEVS